MFKRLNKALHEAFKLHRNSFGDSIGPIISVASTVLGGLFAPSPPDAPSAPAALPAPPTINSTEVAAAQLAEQERRVKSAGIANTNITQGTLGAPNPNELKRPTLLGG